MTPKNVKLFLNDAKEIDDSVLIEGLHGIGKSSIVKQCAKENNMHYELLILSIKEPGDLLGMPEIDKSDGTTRTVWAEPDWFQRIIDKAWPLEFEFDDLIFYDKEFEKFVKEKINV